MTLAGPRATDFQRETQSANEKDKTMTETSLDQLGPVDYVVVEFPAGASNFTGEMAKELVALVDSGTIRLVDVLILTKNEDVRSRQPSFPTSTSSESYKHSRPSWRSYWPPTTSSTWPPRWSQGAPPGCSSGRTYGLRHSQQQRGVPVAN